MNTLGLMQLYAQQRTFGSVLKSLPLGTCLLLQWEGSTIHNCVFLLMNLTLQICSSVSQHFLIAPRTEPMSHTASYVPLAPLLSNVPCPYPTGLTQIQPFVVLQSKPFLFCLTHLTPVILHSSKIDISYSRKRSLPTPGAFRAIGCQYPSTTLNPYIYILHCIPTLIHYSLALIGYKDSEQGSA